MPQQEVWRPLRAIHDDAVVAPGPTLCDDALDLLAATALDVALPGDEAMLVGVTTRIIACPCALGMATPMTLTTGAGLGAQNGILIRSGSALQAASKLQTVVLDKTGALQSWPDEAR